MPFNGPPQNSNKPHLSSFRLTTRLLESKHCRPVGELVFAEWANEKSSALAGNSGTNLFLGYLLFQALSMPSSVSWNELLNLSEPQLCY